MHIEIHRTAKEQTYITSCDSLGELFCVHILHRNMYASVYSLGLFYDHTGFYLVVTNELLLSAHFHLLTFLPFIVNCAEILNHIA